MPLRRRNFARRNRRFPRRKAAQLATRPRLMSRTEATKRYHQVSTRVFWFKTNRTFRLNSASYQFDPLDVQRIDSVNPKGWTEAKALYDQYKVLGMTLKLFPANVGTEPTIGDSFSVPIGQPQWAINRGNHVMYIDQRKEPLGTNPTSISDIINRGSARMINPRRPWTTSIWRPKGKPLWGSTKDITQVPDSWNGMICHFCEGGTPIPNSSTGQPQTWVVFYYTLTWKVIFRGRQSN